MRLFKIDKDYIDTPLADFLENLLQSWKGTPFHPNMCEKQVGVDCVNFVAAIYSSISNIPFDVLKHNTDISFHNTKKAVEGFHSFLKRYPSSPVPVDVKSEESVITVRPGDAIICGPSNGGPGHCIIAGKTSLWHCSPDGVDTLGLGIFQRGVYHFKQVRRLRGDLICLN